MNKIIGIIFGTIILMIIFILISMILINFGWEWFMVPVFGMQSLTLKQIIGFSFLASAFKSNVKYNKI